MQNSNISKVKEHLQEYLNYKGIDTSKKFHCLNPEHEDNNPSMNYDKQRKKVHCFSCSTDYDLLDLIGVDYKTSDFKEQMKIASEFAGIDYIDNESNYKPKPKHIKEGSRGSATNDLITPSANTKALETQIQANYETYFKEANARLDETNYFDTRGISRETLDRLNVGYDPKAEFDKSSGGTYTLDAVIFPLNKSSYNARNISDGAKQRYAKRGKTSLFNVQALAKNKPVFIVEGEIDALSIEELGYNAIALGGTSNIRLVINAVKEFEPSLPLILALDNDQAGKEATKRLEAELGQINAKYIDATAKELYNDSKDANELLLANRGVLHANLEYFSLEAYKELEREKEDYIAENAITPEKISQFLITARENATKPPIETGFEYLDELLGGGLFEGFYIMGALSSLGKTTLVLQIADNLAQAGHDVLFFSLEQSQDELISKSISRLTLLNAKEQGLSSRVAKTNRGILYARGYEDYPPQDKAIIQKAITDYTLLADRRLYIHEGLGNLGATEIRAIIDTHTKVTGNSPIVFIDYLQILKPHDIRATDKQNTDEAVKQLKIMSRDYKIPVFAISSFNRDNYNNPVNMTSFKESGAIEYSSDVLLGLQFKNLQNSDSSINKDFDVNEEMQRQPRQIQLKVLKNRSGANGTSTFFRYYPMFNYFETDDEANLGTNSYPY